MRLLACGHDAQGFAYFAVTDDILQRTVRFAPRGNRVTCDCRSDRDRDVRRCRHVLWVLAQTLEWDPELDEPTIYMTDGMMRNIHRFADRMETPVQLIHPPLPVSPPELMVGRPPR